MLGSKIVFTTDVIVTIERTDFNLRGSSGKIVSWSETGGWFSMGVKLDEHHAILDEWKNCVYFDTDAMREEFPEWRKSGGFVRWMMQNTRIMTTYEIEIHVEVTKIYMLENIAASSPDEAKQFALDEFMKNLDSEGEHRFEDNADKDVTGVQVVDIREEG